MVAVSCLIVLALVSSVYSETSNSNLRVSTTSGILNGKRSLVLNNTLRLFLGVPYAQAPVGSFRFKPPIPVVSPDIEKDASRFGPSCIQAPHMQSVISPLLFPNRAEINEDCLYLNVYVPDRSDQGSPLPVMVWLAGEGFDFADPQQFDGSYLAVEGKVIVVTVNYRLSVFGFLSSLSEDAPGNVGLLDQRTALKWVKANIHKFGGSAENITLFGRFTGAMSAAIHTFSPLSKEERLFQRVILQSGVPVGDWVFDKNPLNATFALSEAMNCVYSSLSDVVDCLRRQPAERLLTTALTIPHRFRPVYDFHLIYENTLKSVMKSDYAPVDILVGTNNDEGSICTITLNAMKSPMYQKILHRNLSETDFSELVQENMLQYYKTPDSFSNALVIYNYLKSEKELRKAFISFCGDLFITARSQKLADEVAKRGLNVYAYEFRHRPSFSIHPTFIRAGHGDDVLFSMGLPFQLKDLPQDEEKLTRRMVQAIANFARTGDPNGLKPHGQWPRYTIQKREVMAFSTFRDKEKSAVKTSNDEAVNFWFNIIPTARQRPCSPPMAYALATHEALTQPESGQAYFLGSRITIPTAEYLMMGLLGTSCFLFLITVGLIFRSKKTSTFQRLA